MKWGASEGLRLKGRTVMAWRIEGAGGAGGAGAPVEGTGNIIETDFEGATDATVFADEGTVKIVSVPPDLETLTFRGGAEFVVDTAAFMLHWSIRVVHCGVNTAFLGSAFEDAPRLARVTAPPGARLVATCSSFEGCVALETFPFKCAVAVGDSAFKGCTALVGAELTHPELYEITDYAFERCVNLDEVAFGPSLTRIGKHAFKQTTCLGAVVLGRKMRDIAEGAFTRSGMTSFKCDGPATVKRFAGANCPRLETAYVNGNVGLGAFAGSALKFFTGKGYQIGRDAFKECPLCVVDTEAGKIDASVFMMSSVQILTMRYAGDHPQFAVHPGMFAHCSSLRKLRLPAKLGSAPANMCKGCSSLQTIELSDRVTDIEKGAFGDCSLLESVVAPCVRTFTRGSFAHCPKLRIVVAAPGAMAWRPISQHVNDNHDTFKNVFPHSPEMHATDERDGDGRGVWPGGMKKSTPRALNAAHELVFWSRARHERSTRNQREWVFHALVAMARIGLPSVAQLIVLQYIEAAELGPTVAVNARVRVKGRVLDLGWGTVAYIGTVVTRNNVRHTNRIGVRLDRAPPLSAGASVPHGSFIADRRGVFAAPDGFMAGGFAPALRGVIVDADAVVPW